MTRALRIVLAAAALSAAAGAAPAWAHPTLLQAAPAPGVSLPSSPDSLTLAFSEAPIARGSRIALRGPRGPLRVGALHVDGPDLTASVIGRLAPGVYDVSWTALGDDGHTTSGRFRFGVDGAHGAAPPGAEGLAGAGGPGTGEQSAAAQGALSVVARWLLIVCASLLFGGGLVARRAGAAAGWRRLAPLALMIALVAACEAVLAAAGAPGGGLDLGLVTATGAGVAALARLALLAAAAALAARASGRPQPGVVGWTFGAAGGGALVATAFEGHALTAGTLAVAGQVVHVLAAGLWLGGLLALPLVLREGAGWPRAVRAFAPVAAASLLAVAVTGVLAAVREVHRWYFLEWSGYGRAVIVKTALVAAAVAAGAWTTWRVRRGGGSRRVLRAEVALLLGAAAAASVLAALPQGRGQALPAQRGALLAGPAFASVLLPGGGPAPVTLAPARTGANRFVVESSARAGAVRLACACARAPVSAPLRPASAGVLAADVRLPADGTWYAYLTLGARRAASPAALPVGVPRAPGAPPVEVLAVADLTGPDAARCRDFLLGLQLAIGRLNALGGLDGGRKVALLSADRFGGRPLALAGACGPGAAPAVSAAARAGVPALIGDPSVPVTPGAATAFRSAGDPAAEGYADAQYVRRTVQSSAVPGVRTVRVVASAGAQRWIAGWRAGLAGSRLRLQRLAPAALADAGRTGVQRLMDRRGAVAVALDGPPALARALARAGAPRTLRYAPAPIVVSARSYDERFVEAAGITGRLGVLRGASEVAPESQDALAYTQALSGLYPGERPSLQGIRGYVTGLALGYAVRRGTAPAALVRRLRYPAPFTDALASPWRADAPALGSQRFTLVAPTFLSATLIPPSQGGEAYSGRFFTDGAWTRLSSDLYGPPLDAPPLA